jgi:cell division protein DivIC
MIFLGLTSIIIIFVMTFTIGKYWVEIYDKYQEKKELEKELTLLKEKEEELKVDAKKLQNPDYIARYAREKYQYSKDGEFILQIPEE